MYTKQFIKRGIALICAAILLLGLAACQKTAPDSAVSATSEGEEPLGEISLPGEPTAVSPESSAPPDGSGEKEPESQVIDAIWDEAHTLDRTVPPLTRAGLELPVAGATGYAPVTLPLWPDIPRDKPEKQTVKPLSSTAATLLSGEPGILAQTAASSQDTERPSDIPDSFAGPQSGQESSAGDQSDSPDLPLPEGQEEPMPIPEEHMPNEPMPDPEPVPSEPEPEPEEAEDPYAGAVAVLSPGTAFTVLREEGSWWRVESDKGTGWLDHRCCMINLPDVIPSIIYDATNSYGSLYVSSGKALSGVTGKALYPGKTYNPRLNQKQYMMPALYATAKKLCAVQHLALSQGNSLKLYEAYRPYQVQRAVVRALRTLAASDQTVKAGMSSPWGLGSFIATGYSNHQRGFAVDVGLVKVAQTKVRSVGSSSYLEITEYAEYAMPSAMHELSSAAASTVSPNSKTLASTMNEPAIGLRSYFQSVGMSPLTSEWWHFNDYEARNLALSNLSSGDFIISQCKSRIP